MRFKRCPLCRVQHRYITTVIIYMCSHTSFPPPPTRSLRALVSVCVSVRGPVPWQCEGKKYLPIWCKHQSPCLCACMTMCLSSLCVCVCVTGILRDRIRSLWQFSKLFHDAVQFLLGDKFLCHLRFVPLHTVERRRIRQRGWHVTSLTKGRHRGKNAGRRF